MSSSSFITNELLDALLSPDAQRRRQAEEFLNSLSHKDQSWHLLQALTTQLQQSSSTDLLASRHYSQLLAVLLRRTLLQVTESDVLQSVIQSVLQLFLYRAGSITPTVGKSLADCLAQACAVLSFVHFDQAVSAVHQVVQTVQNQMTVSSFDLGLTVLYLWKTLAERAPRAFCCVAWQDANQPSLVEGIVSSNLSIANNPATDAAQRNLLLQALMELVSTSALASTVVTAHDETTMGLWAAGGGSGTDSDLPLDPHSKAAQLGRSCLEPLLACPQVPASSMVQVWMQLAESIPSVFSHVSCLEQMVQICLEIAQHPTNNDQDGEIPLSLLALEVVSSLVGNGFIRRQLVSPEMRQAVLTTGINVCLLGMASDGVTTDDEWASDPVTLLDNEYGNEDEEVFHYAQELLESIIHSFGSHALPVLLPCVEQLLGSCNTTGTRAGLGALQSCLLAAPKSFAPHLPVAMEAALNLYGNSSSVRVQYQALYLLGIVCDLDSEVALRYVGRLLPALQQAVQSPCSKVAAVACSAIVSYCRPEKGAVDGETYVVPYLSDVLAALVAGPLSNDAADVGSVVVKVRAIGAISCLAEASREAFVGIYGSVMPGLLNCVNTPPNANGSGCHELAALRGAAVEAATIVGQAIGEEHRQLYAPDAEKIMGIAVSVLGSEGNQSAIPMDTLLSACARIAAVMQEAYLPYVDVVLPHLLRKATDASDVNISEGDEADLASGKVGQVQVDEETGTESTTVALPGRGLTKVTINTSMIQEKSVAARAIYEHAAALGADFGPYTKTCLDAFLELVRFKYSSELRATSAQTLAVVFEAACADGERIGMDLASLYLPLVVKSVSGQIVEEEEADMEVLYALSEALSDVLYNVYIRLDEHGDRLLANYSINDSTAAVKFCMKAMVACLQRRIKTTSILAGAEGAISGEDEAEHYEAILQSEEQLLTPLVDSVGYNLKFFRDRFLPTFDREVAPVLGPYLSVGNDVRARLSAVCLFDDVIEHCGTTAAAKYAPYLVGGAVAGLDDATNGRDMDLKRASIYGISQICRYAPSKVLLPYEDKIIPTLLSTVASTSKEECDDPAVYEYSVSALGSLVLFGGNPPFKNTRFVKAENLVKVVLKNMPLLEDFDESKFCSAALCDLVEQQGLIRYDTHHAEILRVIGETLALVDSGEEDMVSPETLLRFVSILYRMQKNVCYETLSVDAQESIQKAMAQYAHHFNNVVTP